jgi:pimeloyl-ACP methyl ester carboxylesterase
MAGITVRIWTGSEPWCTDGSMTSTSISSRRKLTSQFVLLQALQLSERLTICRWPHFQAEIEDLNLHFIHMRSESPTAIPLLLVHGWPGSFLEFRYMLDHLVKPTTAGAQAFHVVVPSLPGHAYSETPRQRGWTMQDNARVFNRLMVGLGYAQYMCQGGDWGHQVCRYLGSLFTENCKCRPKHLRSALDVTRAALTPGKNQWSI